jgi:hypothetical protein
MSSSAAEPASAVATATATQVDDAPAPLDRPAAPMSTKKRVDALYNVMGAIEVRGGMM